MQNTKTEQKQFSINRKLTRQIKQSNHAVVGFFLIFSKTYK